MKLKTTIRDWLIWSLALSGLQVEAKTHDSTQDISAVTMMCFWCGPNYGCGGKSTDLSTINPDCSHVAVSFATIDEQGYARYEEWPGYSNDLSAINATTIISAGGAAGNIQGALDNPENFAYSIKNILEKNLALKGVDFDFEPMLTDEQIQPFINLVKTTRKTLGNGIFISITPECTGVYPSDNYNPDYYNQYKDIVNALEAEPAADEITANGEPVDHYVDAWVIQCQNNPYCSVAGNPAGTAEFISDVTKQWIESHEFGDGSYYIGIDPKKVVPLTLAGNETIHDGQGFVPKEALASALETNLNNYGVNPAGFWCAYHDAETNFEISNTISAAQC